MKIVLVGSKGYWGSKLARVCRELGHSIVAEINLPENAVNTLHQRAIEAGADAAILATPPDTHFDLTFTALDAGLDVLIEKPMALHRGDAETLRDLADYKNLVLSVDSTFVHSEIHRWLRGNGPWVSYQSIRIADGPDHVETPASWDLVVHDIAILQALGLIDEDSEMRGCEAADGLTAQAWLRLKYGGEAFINAGRAWHGRVREIMLRHANGSEYLWNESGLWRLRPGIGFETFMSDINEPLKSLIRDFAGRCKRRAMTGLTDAEHGTAVCSILHRLFGDGHRVAGPGLRRAS